MDSRDWLSDVGGRFMGGVVRFSGASGRLAMASCSSGVVWEGEGGVGNPSVIDCSRLSAYVGEASEKARKGCRGCIGYFGACRMVNLGHRPGRRDPHPADFARGNSLADAQRS